MSFSLPFAEIFTLGAALGAAFMYVRLRIKGKESEALRRGLQRSEQESRMLLESAPFPVVLTRVQDGGVEYVNTRATEYWGAPAEKMLAMNAADFYADPAQRKQIQEGIMRDGRIIDFEIALKDQAGNTHFALLTSSISARHGIPVIFSSFSDISELKAAANEITRNEQELRQLLERASIPIVISRTADSQTLFVNRTAGTLLGIDPENLTGVYAKDFHTNELERLAILEKIRQAGYVSGQEFTLQTRNKTQLHVLATVGTTRFQHQDALMITLSDISERKRIEEILRESEERYRFLAENTWDVVWQTDAERNMTYINESDERLRGFPREQVIGRSATQFFEEKYISQIIADWREQDRLESEGTPIGTQIFEAEQICKDGHTIWVEICSTPQRDEHGKIYAFTGITRDISEHKKNEYALQDLNMRLSGQLVQIQSLQAALQEQLIRDSLTGLYNRRYLDDAIERELSRATREGNPVTLAILDIDYFKQVNDKYGHPAGDEVLRTVGKMLRDHTRASDIPCRMGGEEFVVMLPNMGLEDAKVRAEKLRALFAETDIIFGQLTIKATISIGLASYPTHGRSASELIRLADAALYQAKQNGRNQVAIASPL